MIMGKVKIGDTIRIIRMNDDVHIAPKGYQV